MIQNIIVTPFLCIGRPVRLSDMPVLLAHLTPPHESISPVVKTAPAHLKCIFSGTIQLRTVRHCWVMSKQVATGCNKGDIVKCQTESVTDVTKTPVWKAKHMVQCTCSTCSGCYGISHSPEGPSLRERQHTFPLHTCIQHERANVQSPNLG